MEESTIFQAILQRGFSIEYAKTYTEGYASGYLSTVREVIVVSGTARFGHAPASVEAALKRLGYQELLVIARRLQHAASWEELFPPPKERSRKKSS